MGIFGSHLWPYTNLHGINLDYILEKIGTVDQAISEAQTLLTQATETAAMIAEQMTEVRGLVDQVTEDLADAQEVLAQANTRLDQITERLNSLKYEKGCTAARMAAADPQVINIPVRFGQLASDTDLSPVETPQTNTLVTWGPLTIIEDVEPVAENVCPVGYYSTDKALLFAVTPANYYDVAQWRFYYTVDNTQYYEVVPAVRYIDYYAAFFVTVIFPDNAVAWSAVGPNNTDITDKDLLPVLTGKWVHKSVYYNAGVTFANIPDIITFANRAEKHSYYPQTWQIGASDVNGDHILNLSNFYGSGRIMITRVNTGITFAGRMIVENCSADVYVSMSDPTEPFFVHDDSGVFANVISITGSSVYLYMVGILDTAEAPASAIYTNNSDVTIANMDVKGVLAVFKPAALTYSRITINASYQFTGNAGYFKHADSSYADAAFYIGGSSPTLPQITNGQSDVVSTAQSNTIFLLSSGRTVTFTASRQS